MKIFLILGLLLITSAFPQKKYLIYFKEKGIKPGAVLKEGDLYFRKGIELLSARSIERRKKNMGEKNFITYEDLPIKNDYIHQIESLGIKIENKLRWFNAVSAYLDQQQTQKVISLPFIEKIEHVQILKFKREEIFDPQELKRSPSIINGINYGNSFEQLSLISVPPVHLKGITGKGVIVGFLDTGFNWAEHESFAKANVIAERDFIFKDDLTDDQPPFYHGTSVFSTVGGFKDSVLIGAAFDASFILAKTEEVRSETHVEEDNYAAALEWMDSIGVDITSSSLGYSEFDDSTFSYTYEDMNGKNTIVTRAAELAFGRGIVTMTAAGNEGSSNWFYITSPADGFNTIAVGAVNNDNILASFSSHGPTYDGRIKPEIVAQGVNVFAATSFSSYTSSFGGTSAAAPLACGAAALLLSAHPHLRNTQVRNIILETSDNSNNPNNDIGFGLVSASGAVAFPNLEQVGSLFRLHKIFLDEPGVSPNSALIHYSTDGKNFTQANLIYDGIIRYNFIFPQFLANQQVEFYFTYRDSSGADLRDPINKMYKFFYGSLNVSLNLSLQIPFDYGILSQNYPNPFNSLTTIKFKAAANEKAEIFIVDAIGQKIKSLYNDFTKEGENIVLWDGRTDSGIIAASGVYYYILKIGGKEYGKKMVFLK